MKKLHQFLREKRGNLTWLADKIGRTPGAINQWERVPAGLALKVAKLTGIPKEELRPDLYPPRRKRA